MQPTLLLCLTGHIRTRLAVFTLLMLGIGQANINAQTLYQFTNDSTGLYNSIASNMTATGIQLGSAIRHDNAPCGPTEGLGTDGWPTTNVFNVGTFNMNGNYLSFTMTPAVGFGLKVTGFAARSRRENLSGTANDGPTSMRYGFSTDGGVNWTTVNPGNPQSSNLCVSGGVNRVWPIWQDTLTNNPIIFRIYALSSGSSLKGDLFIRDLTVEGTVCANNPTVTPSPISFLVCSGETGHTFEYTVKNADTYSINFDALAEAQGFVDVPVTTLPTPLPMAPGTINWVIPAMAAPGSYSATVSVWNACGFKTDYPVSITVSALPDVSAILSATSICAGGSYTLRFEDNAMTGHLFRVTANLEDDNGTTPIDIPGVFDGASLLLTEGVHFNGNIAGSVTLTDIEIEDQTTGCSITAADITITIVPLPRVSVTLNDMAICDDGEVMLTFTDLDASGRLFTITADLMDDNGLTVEAINYTNLLSGASDTYTEGIDFEGSTGGTVSLTNIVITDQMTGCDTTLADLTISVNPLPVATFMVVPSTPICPGSPIEIFFNETAYSAGTEFTVTGTASTPVFLETMLTFDEVISGDHVDLIEGTDFTGDLTISSILVTEPISGCSASALDVFVDVLPAPEFAFSAASESDGPYVGNNTSGPNTLELDFCGGNHLTLSGYSDNGLVGITIFYTTSGNVTFSGNPLPLSSGPNNVSPAGAAGFFGSVYGGALGYNLNSGTTGTVNQVFVPYLDNDANGTFSAGDCLGDTVFLNYHIYAVPTVDAVANIAVCNGDAVTASFSGNYASGVTYSWTNDNPSIGLAASGTGNISFTGVNAGIVNAVANITVTPSTDQCTGGNTISFSVTVHPDALVTNITGTVGSGDPVSANNLSGPNSLLLNFCAGESFQFSGFNATAQVGFLEQIVAGTQNLLYGITPIPVPRPQSDMSAAAAIGFFNSNLGPYGLASGTYGWLDQVFTPYFDANNDGNYDPGVDCLGDPITIRYSIYAPIVLNIVRTTPQDICSGEMVEYVISTTSTQDITFELVYEENPNLNNPADLSENANLPTTTVYTINSTTPLIGRTFSTTVNNAMGTFDRGRVWVRANNIIYNDVDACTTANVNGPNTRVYPKPALAAISPVLSCDGNMVELNVNLTNTSIRPSTAGFPMQVNWTVSGAGVLEDGATGSAIFLGANLVGGLDTQQMLTLVDPSMGPQTVTLTITPRASGPTNGFNADDCDGDAIIVTVTVVPAPVPTIEGPSCLHDGGEVYLSGFDNIALPAIFISGVWSDDGTGHATVDAFGVVTGVNLGTTVIYYTVTDDAGCTATASHSIEVLSELLIEHEYIAGPVSCGGDFIVSVTVDGFCDVVALDHAFSWNPAQFQFVTATAVPISGGIASVSALNAGMGQLIYSYNVDVPPFGVELSAGTIILTYTLRPTVNSGTFNIPLTIEDESAINSSFSPIPVSTVAVSIQVTPPSLALGTNPVVCPSDDFVDISFTNVTGNPNYYVIDFNALAEAAGFPDKQQGDLDFNDGYIRIPLPNGLLSGSYQATLVISNDDNGCESIVYLFSIIVDQTPPTASNPAPTFLECVTDIPEVNVVIVIDEDDDCTMLPVVAFVSENTVGSGCASSPMVITRVYSVTDEAGNSTAVSHVITVEDDTPPTISTTGLAPWYISGRAAIDAAIARANLTKMDNCSSLLQISVVVSSVDTTGCTGTIILAVTDACGNLAAFGSTTYLVTIDRARPVAVAGTIDDCYEVDDMPTSPYFGYGFAVQAAIDATIATDDCDMMLSIRAEVYGTDCETEIWVIATDDCFKSDTAVYHIRVESDPPSIASDSLALDGMCFDNVQDALDYAVAATMAEDDCTAPGDLQIDASANMGCPAEITVFVTDFCGNFSSIVYTGVHIDVVAPVVNPLLHETCYKTLAAAHFYLARAANPSDNCTDTLDLFANATFSEVEVGILEDACREYDIIITFTDGCDNTVMHTFTSILIDNEAPVATPLSALMFTCLDDVDAPNTDLVVVTDNCAVQDIEHISTVLPTSCPGTGTRTYRAYDCAGNSVTIVQSIMISDTVAPTWVTTPSNHLNRTISCTDLSSILAASLLKPVAQDNCGEVSVVRADSTLLNTCAGGYTRTWRAYDDCGNSSTTVFTQTVTIVDNVAPNWLTMAGALNASVACNDAVGLAAAQALAPTAMDNCTGVTLAKTSGVFVPGMTCPQEGTYTNTWIATDGCGNPSLVFTQVITITDDNGPTWVTPQGQNHPTGLNISVSCSDAAGLAFANTFVPVATDACGGTPVLTKTPGSFVAGGSCVGEGTYTNTWVANDACGNPSIVFTQVITMVDNTPPTFDPMCQFMPLNLFTSDGYDCPSSATLTGLIVGQEINKSYQFNVAGLNIDSLGGCIFDNCGPAASIIVKVMSIENVYDAQNCSRIITVSFQLRDACNNIQPTLFVCIYNIIDDVAPTAAVPTTIGTCFATEQAALDAAIAATTFTEDCTDVMDLEVSAVRSGTLCNATITITATDCAGNTSLPVLYNTRIDGIGPVMTVSNIATCYPTIAAAQAAAIAGTTITDNCSSYGQLIITATTVGTCPATVTVTATDQCGISSSVAYNGLCIGASSLVDITVDADDLTVDCMEWMGDLEDWLDDNGGAVATGSGIVWTYMPLDPATVLQNSMANCTTHTKSVTVTFRATNGCGNFEETTAIFSLLDLTPPTANLIANSNLACSTAIPTQNPEIVTGESDNCGGTPTVAWFASSDNGAAGCALTPRIVTHQYIVTDDYCNTSLVNQMITVVDNVKPSFTGPANITINVNAACVYNAAPVITGDITDENDNCTPSGPGLQAFYTDVVNPGVNFQQKFIITRTWQLLDACGNSAIPRVQTITVLDVTTPTITGCPANLTLPGGTSECVAAYGNQTQPSFSDNCSGASISYKLAGATPGMGLGYIGNMTSIGEGVTTVTYTVTDQVGNTASCSFTITVNCLSIAGSIIWEHDRVSGVNNATVNVTSTAPVFMGSDLSDTNGDYEVSVPAAGTYRVRPVKNINRLNGVTAADAARITNHVNFSNPITNPYKKVCADVNRSGIINTQDATLITQSILGNPTALAVFNVFWRFVPQDFIMPVTAHQNVPVFPDFKDVTLMALDAVDIDFFGMKIGDVDSVWANPANLQAPAPLVWALKDQTLVAGTSLDLAFEAVHFSDLAAYQFALDFDPMVLEFVGFEALDAISLNLNDNFGAYQANLGELRHVWSNSQGVTLADGTPVFRAKFKVLQSGQQLGQVLRLDDSQIECKAFNQALISTDVRLVFGASVAVKDPLVTNNLQLQLMQNRPNPFADATTIGFILPEACEAHIRILDISGRELTSYDRKYTAGYHELEFRMDNAASYGVLFCELVTPQGKRTIKMITAK